VELAAKPPLLLFVDEPTSGLDSQTSWAILDLLEKLTKSGQAILCTIHQPSAMLFQRFDRLLFLAKGGKTVYFGDIGENSKAMTSYFERQGAAPCPPEANPAEWMLEVIGAAPGSHSDTDWFKAWRDSPEFAAVHQELDRLKDEPVDRPARKEDQASYREFAAGFGSQLFEVTHRVFQQYWRTPSYIYSKTVLCVLVALFIGFVFYNAPNTIQGLQNQMFAIFNLCKWSFFVLPFFLCWVCPFKNRSARSIVEEGEPRPDNQPQPKPQSISVLGNAVRPDWPLNPVLVPAAPDAHVHTSSVTPAFFNPRWIHSLCSFSLANPWILSSTVTVFGQLVQQTMPHFVIQRSLYEVRERPSKVYGWKVFMLSQIIVELPWNTLMAALMYFCWYYPVGLYHNAEVAGEVAERGALMFLLLLGFMLFTSTFTDFIIAGFETAEAGGNIANLLFTLCLIFCGVLANPDTLPGFWIFMYRISPFSYIVSAMLATAVANTEVQCAPNEFLQFQPPANMSCGDYMNPYIGALGGRLADPDARDMCSFCSISDTNVFLKSVRADYADRWRNFGILWAYVIFNIFAGLALYWIARVPKNKKVGSKKKKE